MFGAIFVVGLFSLIAAGALLVRSHLRKMEALDSGLSAYLGFAGKDADSMDRLFAMMFRRNKSGVISFQPLAVLLFALWFICLFPFNSVFHAKDKTNPKLLQYWEQVGGQDGYNKMSSAQKDEVNKKMESLLSDKT